MLVIKVSPYTILPIITTSHGYYLQLKGGYLLPIRLHNEANPRVVFELNDGVYSW